MVGAVLEGPQFHPGRTGRNHLRVVATAAGLPGAGSTRCSGSWSWTAPAASA